MTSGVPSLSLSDLHRSVVPTLSALCGVCLFCDSLFNRQLPGSPAPPPPGPSWGWCGAGAGAEGSTLSSYL